MIRMIVEGMRLFKTDGDSETIKKDISHKYGSHSSENSWEETEIEKECCRMV